MKHLALIASLTIATAGSANAATVLVGVEGAVFDSASSFATVDDAISFADTNTAVGTFTVGTLNYPASANTTSSSNTVTDILGADAASFVGSDVQLQTSVFVFEGLIDLAGGSQSFTVGSDDGFALFIDGAEVSRFSNPRSYNETTVTADLGVGLKTFKLVYYENFGNTGVAFEIDGAAVTNVDPVPLPMAAPLMAGGLVTLTAARRRRKRG